MVPACLMLMEEEPLHILTYRSLDPRYLLCSQVAVGSPAYNVMII